MKYKVACLDVWTPSVRAEVSRVATAEFELVFASSDEPAHQMELSQDADFIVPGFASVNAAMIAQCTRLKLVHKWGIGID